MLMLVLAFGLRLCLYPEATRMNTSFGLAIWTEVGCGELTPCCLPYAQILNLVNPTLGFYIYRDCVGEHRYGCYCIGGSVMLNSSMWLDWHVC
jgi:hypothetical protein